jgi:hypothetical protein
MRLNYILYSFFFVTVSCFDYIPKDVDDVFITYNKNGTRIYIKVKDVYKEFNKKFLK